MNPLQKGMLATFSGVVFGSLVSLAIWQMWALDALVGGVITAGLSAYIFFDIKKVLLAVPQAWEKARGWRPSNELKKGLKILLKAISVIIVGVTAWVTLLFLLIPDAIQYLYTREFLLMLVGSMLLFEFAFIYVLKRLHGGNRISIKTFWLSSPIVILILVLDILKGIAWLATIGIPWIYQIALPTIGRFFKELLIAIHCRDRMMCLIDSSLGMIVAFLVQWQFIGGGQLLSIASILVGGLTGTAFFFFRREIVAIKWLKIQPNGHQT